MCKLLQSVVQATGALEGRTSTTYWRAADELRGVGVTVEGARYVQVYKGANDLSYLDSIIRMENSGVRKWTISDPISVRKCQFYER